jgi:hypothetical protein
MNAKYDDLFLLDFQPFLQFDLMCEDNEWKMALIGSINSLGVLFSVPIVGYIADR